MRPAAAAATSSRETKFTGAEELEAYTPCARDIFAWSRKDSAKNAIRKIDHCLAERMRACSGTKNDSQRCGSSANRVPTADT